jgi:hypothetical protein
LILLLAIVHRSFDLALQRDVARRDGLVFFETHFVLLGNYVAAIAFDLVNHDVDVPREPSSRSLFHVKKERVKRRSQLLQLV